MKRLVVVSLALLVASAAQAGTATASLNVTSTVSGNCTISTTPVAFGAYDPVGTNATTPSNNTGTVSISCTKGTTTPISLDLGANATGSTRRMTDGTDYLTYELYQDTGRTTVWGASGSAQYTPAVSPGKAARAFTIFAQIAAGQDVGAGSYTDTVTATVNF